jgi:glycosyltransferase involved in cell wall biosynthesis
VRAPKLDGLSRLDEPDRPADPRQRTVDRLARTARRMRVLIVNPEGLAERGGMGRMVRYLVEAVRTRADGPEVEVLDSRGGPSPWFMPFYLARTLVEIVRARLKKDVRLVHVNMAENTSVLRKGAVVLFCRALGVPVMLHLHAGLFIPFYERLPRLGQDWLKLVFRAANQTVVLGELWRRYLIGTLGVPGGKIAVVPNGVARLKPRRRSGSNEPCRLIYVGKLRSEKGLNELIEALAQPDIAALPWSLTLVGDGDRAGFVAAVAQSGLSERVRFEGWLEPQAVAERLARSDVYVLPSHHEGMPLAMLEAMSAGLAVVTTAVGAIPEILTDGKTALLVPPKNLQALHDALYRVITDWALRESLGAAGEQLYDERFTLERFTDAILALYDKLAPAKR